MEMDADYEFPWTDLFEWSDSPYYGYVYSLERANDIVSEFSFATSTFYVETRCTRNFGSDAFINDASGKPHCIRWTDDGKIKHGTKLNMGGKPFMVIGSRLMECHQGINHRQAESKPNEGDHEYQQISSKKKATGTKKRGCPSAVYMRDVISFPEYKLENNTAYHREITSKRLRNDLQSSLGGDIEMDRVIFIDLPNPKESHQGHIMGDASALKAPIDPRVVNNINHLIDEGFYNVMELKRNNNLFVKTLFGNEGLPKNINRRFYPSREDLRQMVYRRRRKIQQGLLDQDLLDLKIKEWKLQHPEDRWFFRQSAHVKRPAVEGEEEGYDTIVSEEQPFLLVFQTGWQRHLLHRYGKEIVFLDATYKTMKYALPLFFLCVHTNAGYAVVGTFIMENENSKSLAEALQIFEGMNEQWATKSFMVDASEIEANAIMATFPNVQIFVCDFHRKQAWNRWVSSLKNGVAGHKDEILDLLNKIAESQSEKTYKENMEKLTESNIWKSSQQLQNYLTNQWFTEDMVKKWVWMYRNENMTIVVNTNNGVEAQNHVFKQEYLLPYRTTTVSGVMGVLVREYFEDVYRKYLNCNVTMSEGWRQGSSNIPPELHHRPLYLVQHMREITNKAATIDVKLVTMVDENSFQVKSSSLGGIYNIALDNGNSMPSCTCYQFMKTHLPCKHFAAVFHKFQLTWNSLPDSYISNEMFTVDPYCVNTIIQPSEQLSSGCLNANVMKEEEPNMEVDESEVEEEEVPKIKGATKKLREELAGISSLSYLVKDTDIDVVKSCTDQLSKIRQMLKAVCPTEEGLLLENDTCKPNTEGKSKGKANTRKILRKLPSRKKRQVNRNKKNVTFSRDCKTTSDHKVITRPQKRKLETHSAEKKEPHEKEIKLNFRATKPVKTRKLTDPQSKSKFSQDIQSDLTDVDLAKQEIMPKFKEYLQSLTKQQWDDLSVKAKYVRGVDAKRAGVALDVAMDDEKSLLSVLKKYVPSSISGLHLVEILFILISKMVDDGKITLERDPKVTKELADQRMKELLDFVESQDLWKKCSASDTCFSFEEEFMKDLKREGVLKNSSYTTFRNIKTRYHVAGEAMEGRDLRTLQGTNWFNDKVINAYLLYMQGVQNNLGRDHIYILPSYLEVLWGNGRFNTWFYRQVHFELYHWIFLPINKNGNHWILLTANIPNRTVSILDSMGGNNDKYIQQWRQFMKNRAKAVNELENVKWETGKIRSSRQSDGHSCGPFVLMNALALTKGIPPDHLSQRSATLMRQYVLARLAEAATKPPAQRTVCDMPDCSKPSKQMWIQCDVCGRWLHFSCTNIDKKPAGDYVCTICNAQYS